MRPKRVDNTLIFLYNIFFLYFDRFVKNILIYMFAFAHARTKMQKLVFFLVVFYQEKENDRAGMSTSKRYLHRTKRSL